MIVDVGTKLHVIYRALYDSSLRRHFVGVVEAADGSVCRIRGYAFVTNPQTRMFEKRAGQRTTVIDLAESGYITNIIHPDTDIEAVSYRYARDVGLVATDDQAFTLNINEYGTRH